MHSPRDALRRIEASMFRPIDIAWLAAFRVLFGLVMCVSLLRFLAYGWVDDFFVRPAIHFKYWGFAWIEPLSASGMHALFWILSVLSLAVAAGAFFRVSAIAFAAGFSYLQLIDVTTYLNHYYLAGLLAWLLAISPAHRAFSVDAMRDPTGARQEIPAVWLYLFRFQIGVVYTFAGLAKAHTDWLVYAEPLTIWLGSHSDMPLLGPLFVKAWTPVMASWAGFLFDTTVVWFLLVPRLRLLAFAAVIAFHTATRTLFPIGMFSVIMVLSALVFFPANWPKILAARARADLLPTRIRAVLFPGTRTPRPEELQGLSASRNWSRTLGLCLAAAYGLVQIAIPLRFALYGGNVLWHEQGMRFSWRVMVREKNGSVTFVVRDPSTGRTWQVNPRAYLTRLQEREISGQPDLILQMAHRIRDDYERKGIRSVEVRADALVSLNGRRLARLIDPDVDLARISDGIARAAWILPGPTEAPPHLTPL